MMKILLFLPFLIEILQITSAATNATQNNDISSNNIKTTADKLSPDIRSVLLQAIDKLEREAAESSNHEEDDENENHSSSVTGTESSNLIPTVQFYTASAEDASQDISPEGDIILKTIFKNAAPKELDADDIKIHFAAPTTSAPKKKLKNNQQTRSVSSNEISDDKKSEIIAPTTIRPKLNSIRRKTSTVSTTTTTKKPAPTHNEDGENIEVVEKKDIKIFKAPLVTAFSVQQDDKGTLKKVVPLLNDRSVTTTVNPLIKPLFSGGAVIEKLKVTATNVSNILLPTPSPPVQRTTTTLQPTQNSISNEPKGIPVPSFLRSEIFKSNSIVKSNEVPILPLEQQQNSFSAQQNFPVTPNFSNSNPNSESLNNYLLERQRFLEQQILQLQIQARQQQEQIILQQRLLEEQRRVKLEEQNSGLKNQVNSPTKNFKSSLAVRPSLEIIPSISQSSKYEVHLDNVNNHLSDKNIINFHPTFIPFNSNNFNNNNHHHLQQRTASVHIQSSNQLNPVQPQTHFIPPSPPLITPSISSPLELSAFPQLPQKSFQPFKSQPQLPVQQISSSLPISDHLQPRTRHFRQENGAASFGASSFFNSEPSARFQRNGFLPENQSQNLVFQPALNHGISPFTTTQNFHFTAPGQFAGNF